MPNLVPQHPASQQQGLGAPQAAEPQNPYYTPNAALNAANANVANAQASQAISERDILAAQAGGLGNVVEAGPTITPQEVQMGQLADGILRGQIGQEQLAQLIQAGEVDPAIAEAAMGQVQQMMQADQQLGGLGQF